jgi:hypothetical protein
MRFDPMAVMTMGFAALSKEQNWNGQWTSARVDTFKKHYGSCPVVLSRMWNDMMATRTDLSRDDRSVKGFDKERIILFGRTQNIFSYSHSISNRLQRETLKESSSGAGLACWRI